MFKWEMFNMHLSSLPEKKGILSLLSSIKWSVWPPTTNARIVIVRGVYATIAQDQNSFVVAGINKNGQSVQQPQLSYVRVLYVL